MANANYSLVGWQAEKWIAVNNVANKIAKLAFEMGKDDKKTLTTGETWALGSGYELNHQCRRCKSITKTGMVHTEERWSINR